MFDIIVDIIYAILFMGWWAALIKYRKTVKEWTGNIYWAEKYLGRWGTYLIIIAFGLGMIFLGVTAPFGWLNVFMEWDTQIVQSEEIE